MLHKIITFLKEYWILWVALVLISGISGAPQFLAKHALGDRYQGIHFLFIGNEEFYMARIQEVVDGYGRVASPFLYEYKNAKVILPAWGELLYALPVMLFKIPLAEVMIASKYITPALFGAVIFWLLYLLADGPKRDRLVIGSAGALLVTLGYELVDFRTVINLLRGHATESLLVIWTRPVNPVFGGLTLFSSLALIWLMYQERSRYLYVPAGILVGLGICYYFSWALGVVLLGLLFLLSLYQKKYRVARECLYALGIQLLVTAHYWYTVIFSFSSSDSRILQMRNGMLFFHTPIINKVVLAGSLIFFASWLCSAYKNRIVHKQSEPWWFFCALLMLSSWIVFNQQIITGRAIWPYHFVQYTIPITMIVLVILLNNYWLPKFSRIVFWLVFGGISLVSIGFGVLSVSTYTVALPAFERVQEYAPLFSWIKTQPKDTVFLAVEKNNFLPDYIPAFTAGNSYVTNYNQISTPPVRLYHDVMVVMRLDGVTSSTMAEYLIKRDGWFRSYFASDWKHLFSTEYDPAVEAARQEIFKHYPVFLSTSFSDELNHYRLDYIVADKPLDPALLKQLPGLGRPETIGMFTVYPYHP
jgi:hypothetical protein